MGFIFITNNVIPSKNKYPTVTYDITITMNIYYVCVYTMLYATGFGLVSRVIAKIQYR